MVGLRVYRLCLHPRTDGFGLLEVWRGPSDEELRALDWLARWAASDAFSAEYSMDATGRLPIDSAGVQRETHETGAKYSKKYSILWHCVNGRERTGLLSGMVVRYRYGWTREQAYRYMLDTGFRPLAVGAARAWERWNRRIYR